MGDENKKGSEEQDSIWVRIVIFSAVIVIMLVYLLVIIERREKALETENKTESEKETPFATASSGKTAGSDSEKKTEYTPVSSKTYAYNPDESESEPEKETKSGAAFSVKQKYNPDEKESQPEKETKYAQVSSGKSRYTPDEKQTEDQEKTDFGNSKSIAAIISEIADVAKMYSREDTSLVTKKLGELLDDLADAIKENKIQDTKKVMKELGEMADNIMECIKIQRDKMSDSEKKNLTQKTENLKECLKPYLMEDAGPVAEKLDSLVTFINDKPEPGIIGKINQITDFAEIYSRKDVSPVTKKLLDLLDDLVAAVKKREVKETEKVMWHLEKMLDKIAEYIRIQGNRISESDRKELTEKAEKLKAGLKPYLMKDAYPVAQKLDIVITLLAPKKEEGEKPEPVKTEPVKTEPVKSEQIKTEPLTSEPAKAAEPVKTEPLTSESAKAAEQVKTEPAKTEPLTSESAKTEKENKAKQTKPYETDTDGEEISPVFTLPDNVLTSQELNALRQMEKDAISTKTLCKNKQNTVHFLSSQLLVRLVDIYPSDNLYSSSVAMIDVTHPRLGLRRFSEMEEGTVRPFEYGSKVFFLELLKIYPNCADVAVYERKSSS